MALNRYQRTAYRVFGASVETKAQSSSHLRTSLKKALVQLRPEVYLSICYLNMLLVFAATMVPIAGAAALTGLGVLDAPLTLFVFLLPLPFVLAGMVYLVTFVLPDVRASARARDIDTKLPYALNYIATMANAGITPVRIFEGLSRQPIYGEVANEAALICRDVNLFGKDILTALSAAIDRSPSIRLQDLLQGAITTLTSGGNLKEYFMSKSEQFLHDNRQEQRRFIDGLGVLAESFVTVVVAAPLFLLILITVMTSFSSGATGDALLLGYVIVLGMLPLSQVGFAVAIKASTPEA